MKAVRTLALLISKAMETVRELSARFLETKSIRFLLSEQEQVFFNEPIANPPAQKWKYQLSTQKTE